MKKLFYSLLLTIACVSLHSCVEESKDLTQYLPVINKTVFDNIGTNIVDTLYSDKEEIFIGGVSLQDAAADTTMATCNCRYEETKLKNNYYFSEEEVIYGRVTYNENKVVTLVEIYDVCTIRLIEVEGHKTAFEITPCENLSGKKVTLNINNKGYGTSVTITDVPSNGTLR